MHFYQFHIGDYISHTRHLSLMEDLAFRRLLDYYYLHECPIKQRDIARQIGMLEQEQEVLTVLNEFFVSTEDGFIHGRADEEIAKYRKLSEDGKRGAAMRWAKGGHSPPNATPIATNNHKPITNNHIDTPDGVDKFVWEDFLQIRKKRRAPISDRVIEGLTEQAKAAGVTLNDALKECVVRGWQSFKADWIKPKVVDLAKQTVPSRQGRDPVLLKIEEDSKQAVPPSLEVLERMAKIRKGAA